MILSGLIQWLSPKAKEAPSKKNLEGASFLPHTRLTKRSLYFKAQEVIQEKTFTLCHSMGA